MTKIILTFLTALVFNSGFSQTLVSNREQIEKAKTALKNDIEDFSSGMVNSDLNICITKLLSTANNEYKKYIVGGMLYEIDPKQSFKLHEEAWMANKTEQNFMLEYAIELHRSGQYKQAAELYENYALKEPKDIRMYVWLTDCYMNIGETGKSISNWSKADHSKNHTSIDQAIYTIYGNTTQIKTRNDLKLEIEKGKFSNFYPLLFLDQNWELDWWNKNAQEYFLNADIKLAEQKLGATNNDFRILKAYLDIKKLEENGKSDEIRKILIDNKIILNDNPLPAFGEIVSDLLRICFTNKLLSESEFYAKRGTELLDFAKKTKDKDLLNIYAYLQATVDGKVNPEIDKMGWKDFKDERFAMSYFMGKAAKNRFDDIELKEALNDFPNSSKLYWIKTNCAKIENKNLKPVLIELIKKEFKTLGSDQSHFSYALNSYFGYLQTEK